MDGRRTAPRRHGQDHIGSPTHTLGGPSDNRRAFVVAVLLIIATIVQFLVGTFVPGLERFEDKGFGYRLTFGTAAMLVLPVVWTLVRRRRPEISAVPWWASALIAGSFFVDATGNSLDLYDSWDAFDNVSHFLTWFLLLWGIGLLLVRVDLRPWWALGATVVGLAAVFAIGWELGEWYTFIRRGHELDGAYEDTLSDQALGLLGGVAAAVLVNRIRRRSARK